MGNNCVLPFSSHRDKAAILQTLTAQKFNHKIVHYSSKKEKAYFLVHLLQRFNKLKEWVEHLSSVFRVPNVT